MAANFNVETTEQIENTIIAIIEKTFKDRVAKHIKSELIKEYEAQVYSYIGTGRYQRRNSLLNEETYRQEDKVIGDMVSLVIDNIVHPSPSAISPTKYPIDDNAYLADWIENGNIANPWNNKSYSWMKKRKVFKAVEDRLMRDGAIEGILKEELIKSGFNFV